MWSVEGEVWSLKCSVGSLEYGVLSVEGRVWSVECKV